MINSGRNMAPREGARPVPVRQERPEGRGRTDAQARVTKCFAGVRESCAAGSQTTHAGRTEVRSQASQS
jgi:hypothetical protein